MREGGLQFAGAHERNDGALLRHGAPERAPELALGGEPRRHGMRASAQTPPERRGGSPPVFGAPPFVSESAPRGVCLLVGTPRSRFQPGILLIIRSAPKVRLSGSKIKDGHSIRPPSLEFPIGRVRCGE